MKWFTAFSYRTYFYRSLAALVVGIIMLFVPNDTLNTLVRLIGLFVLLAGVGTAITAHYASHNLLSSMGGIASIVSIVIGILLISRPDFFVDMVITLLGVLLLIFGLIQIVNVANMRNEISHPRFFIAGGLIPLLVGLVFLLFQEQVKSFIGIVLGLTLIFYALNEFGLGYRIQKHFKATNAKVEDVDFEDLADE